MAILVTGAIGNVGRLVVDELLAVGATGGPGADRDLGTGRVAAAGP
jgi:uncharacterized protein YbjT (DUF2867 family)